MTGIGDYLPAVLWGLAVHLAGWALGDTACERILGPVPPEPGDGTRPTIAAALGFLLLGTFAFALGAIGFLRPSVLVATVLACVVLGGWRLSRLWRARGRLPRAAWILPVIAALVVGAFLPEALYPVLGHDDNAHHLMLPKRYLHDGRLTSLPWFLFANMPHMLDLLNAYALAVGDFVAPRVFVLGFAAWTAAGLAAIGRAAAGTLDGLLLALLFLSGPNVAWHFGWAHSEFGLGLFALAAVLTLQRFESSRARGDLVLLGAFCGALMASKYTGWVIVAAVLSVATWRLLRSDRLRRRAAIGGLAAVAMLCLAFVSPWLVKNAIVTGNPVYPLLYRVFGGDHWSEIQDLHYRLRVTRVGADAKDWISYVRLPVDLLVRDPGFFQCPPFSAALLLAFACATARGLVRPRESPAAVPIAVVGFAAWAATAQQGRFLVPWTPVMALATLEILRRLSSRPALLRTATGVAAALAIVQYAQGTWLDDPVLDTFREPRAVLERRNAHYELCRRLDSTVPAGERVLVVWENRMYFLDHDYVADSNYEAPNVLADLRALDSAARFARNLADAGFSHVVVQPFTASRYFRNEFEFSVIDPVVYPESRLRRDSELMEEFFRDHLDPLWRTYDGAVYRLRREAAPEKR